MLYGCRKAAHERRRRRPGRRAASAQCCSGRCLASPPAPVASVEWPSGIWQLVCIQMQVVESFASASRAESLHHVIACFFSMLFGCCFHTGIVPHDFTEDCIYPELGACSSFRECCLVSLVLLWHCPRLVR